MIVSQGGVDDFNWTGNPHRWSQAQKIKSLSSPFALQVVLILDQLEAEGFQPSIRLAWRDLEAQRKLVRENKSDSTFSYHNVVDGNARPAGLAIDVYDRRYGWGEAGPSALRGAARFFKRLGELARAQQGLGWGGDPKRYNIDRSGNAWKPYGMGWDPGHVFDDVPDWKGVKLASLNALTEPQVMAAAYGGTGLDGPDPVEYGATSSKYLAGIDVAHHQGTIHWAQVAQDPSNVQYVMVKTTDGINLDVGLGRTRHDGPAQANAHGAKKQGMKVGYYHYSRPRRSPSVQANAVAEADYFLAKIQALGLPDSDLPLALDLEDLVPKRDANGKAMKDEKGKPVMQPPLGKREMATWALTFLRRLEDKTGLTPMLYTGAWYINAYVDADPALSRYPLWVSYYPNDPAPQLPRGFGDWAIWQHSGSGQVKGIPEHVVDLNWTTPSKLQALLDLAVPARRAPSTRAPVTSSGGGGGGGGMAILLLGGIAAAVIAGSSK